jgi:hypothetical protein
MGEIEGVGIQRLAAHDGQYRAPRRRPGDHWRGVGLVGSRNVPPAQPTRWEHFLDELGMTDADALLALRERHVSSVRVSRFVNRWFRNVFIPESILAELDLLRTLDQMPLQSIRVSRRNEFELEGAE